MQWQLSWTQQFEQYSGGSCGYDHQPKGLMKGRELYAQMKYHQLLKIYSSPKRKCDTLFLIAGTWLEINNHAGRVNILLMTVMKSALSNAQNHILVAVMQEHSQYDFNQFMSMKTHRWKCGASRRPALVSSDYSNVTCMLFHRTVGHGHTLSHDRPEQNSPGLFTIRPQLQCQEVTSKFVMNIMRTGSCSHVGPILAPRQGANYPFTALITTKSVGNWNYFNVRFNLCSNGMYFFIFTHQLLYRRYPMNIWGPQLAWTMLRKHVVVRLANCKRNFRRHNNWLRKSRELILQKGHAQTT